MLALASLVQLLLEEVYEEELTTLGNWCLIFDVIVVKKSPFLVVSVPEEGLCGVQSHQVEQDGSFDPSVHINYIHLGALIVLESYDRCCLQTVIGVLSNTVL